jgi:hypothetical protein
VIDTVRDQLILEVQSSTHPRGVRLDSNSSLDTKENSPVRSIHRITPQPQAMDYQQYNPFRTTPNYPSYTSTSGFNQYDNNRDQRYTDSYGRAVTNPLPAIFRTAAMASNSPSSASTRGQQVNYRPATSNNIYDTPRSYNGASSSGYISDTNDLRRSSISIRPTNSNVRRTTNTNNQQSYYSPSPVSYNTKITTSNDQNYYSDSEFVTSGPRYTKISRQINPTRRPSNVVLPIRSMTSKAYDEYVPPEPPKPKQQPFDVYRQQQEQQQRERERQEQLQRQLYHQQQQAAAVAAARFKPPQLTLPSQDQRRKSDTTIDRELGAELLKSPIANKKHYADSSFFKTPFNTYPTIEEQKKMAHKIASILQGGDPTQKGATKFEKQRQRAEKYTLEAEPTTPTLNTSNYRPLRPLQTNDSSYSNHQPPYYDTSDIPDCIKHSLDEAQHMNPLRYVGAPEEFKQMHMQEHVTHTNVPPQAAMSLVADLNQNRGKGAALFQKRKARSEKWVVDENNVKKSGYQPTSTYIGPATKPWGQHAPASWSGDEGPYSGPNFSPIRPKFNPPPTSSVPESILSPPPTQNAPRYGDFNAKPKGFGTWNAENGASQSPRGSIDARKPLSISLEPSIREGIAESHTRTASQPWSPSYNTQAIFSPNQPQTNDYFNYPTDNVLGKWKNQEYSPWNQQRVQDQQQSQIPMTREGVEQLRQRLTQQNQSSADQQYKQHATYNQRSGNSASYNPYSSSQGSTQQQHFTDL